MTNDTGFFHEVNKPILLRFHHPANDKTAKFKEDYYRRLILLFLPWRNESNDLTQGEDESFEGAYHRIMADENLAHVAAAISKFEAESVKWQHDAVEEANEETDQTPADAIAVSDDLDIDVTGHAPVADVIADDDNDNIGQYICIIFVL